MAMSTMLASSPLQRSPSTSRAGGRDTSTCPSTSRGRLQASAGVESVASGDARLPGATARNQRDRLGPGGCSLRRVARGRLERARAGCRHPELDREHSRRRFSICRKAASRGAISGLRPGGVCPRGLVAVVEQGMQRRGHQGTGEIPSARRGRPRRKRRGEQRKPGVVDGKSERRSTSDDAGESTRETQPSKGRRRAVDPIGGSDG